jgi:hypothetical protein
MKFKKTAIAILGAVILIGAVGAAVLYWRLEFGNSNANSEGKSTEEIWSSVLCRGRLYLQKAKGEISDLSWTELWGLTLPGRGYNCT